MTLAPVGFQALAVSLPETVRTNDYFRQRYPELVAQAEQKSLARLFATTQAAAASSRSFDEAMARHLGDPFRGALERRVLAPGETSLEHERVACTRALQAAGLTPRDVDLLLVGSFQPDQPGVGNATFLARALELTCPAWNLESACSTALVAFQIACALVRTGQARRVLVAISCSYSRDSDPEDTLSWFMGDAAGAFVVGPTSPGSGVLGQVVIDTQQTCGTFYYANEATHDGGRLRLRCSRETQRILRETSAEYVGAACRGALDAAGVSAAQIDHFVFNTPTAWFAAFACDVLGVPATKAIDAYARYGNIGPALMPVNLWEAARQRRFAPDELVCIYTIGSVSTASAAVVRWGDVSVWNGR